MRIKHALRHRGHVQGHPHPHCGRPGRGRLYSSAEHPLGLWTLNGRHLARKDATDLLLKTVQADFGSTACAAESQRRRAADDGRLRQKRVDIHLDGEDQPTKTWFIGTPTQSHTGTHMLLELPGKAAAPPRPTSHTWKALRASSPHASSPPRTNGGTQACTRAARRHCSPSARDRSTMTGKMATLEWNVDGSGLVAIADYERLALTPAEFCGTNGCECVTCTSKPGTAT